MIRWVIPGRLARSARPGYIDEGSLTRREDIETWVAEAKKLGIQGIICLLDDELEWYEQPELRGGLLEYYRLEGFAVCHLPIRDYLIPPVSTEKLQEAWHQYEELPKPVLVHCKAGVDRTGAVITFIRKKLSHD